jgi:hypothetical protein
MEIKLRNGESVLLDPEDYERVRGFQWKKHPQGYASIEFTMHRFLFHPVPPGHEIHHINGNKLDNRRSNLLLIVAKEHRQLHAPALVKHQKDGQTYPDQKTCVVCGSRFTVNPRKRKRNKTCSQECAMKMRIDGRKRQAASSLPSRSKSVKRSLKSKEE